MKPGVRYTLVHLLRLADLLTLCQSMTVASSEKFWGLVVEPGKKYSQAVPESFKMSMAALGADAELSEVASSSGKSGRTTVMLEIDGRDSFALCSLTPGKLEQQQLDLCFDAGEEVAFHVEGPYPIHLTGYHTEPMFDDMSDEDDEEDDEEDNEEDNEEDDEMLWDEDDEDDEDEEDEEDEEDGSDTFVSADEDDEEPRIKIVESDEELTQEAASKKKRSVQFDASVEAHQKEAKQSKPEPTKTAPAKAVPAKNEPTKTVSVKAEPVKQTKPVETKTTENKAPVCKTLPSGLKIEDLKLGSGQKASAPKAVLIHYKGMFPNGKVFDSSHGGKPLKFTLGKGEVVKGMDMGVQGMHIGGTRKLTIPPQLGYGNKPSGPIPANSTLIFEVQLVKIL
jgi:FK506-binding nuclear protein